MVFSVVCEPSVHQNNKTWTADLTSTNEADQFSCRVFCVSLVTTEGSVVNGAAKGGIYLFPLHGVAPPLVGSGTCGMRQPRQR